eukprot:7121220-Pyramimonas_sp.AAC.1
MTVWGVVFRELKSGVALFDFKNAFPSVWHSWIFFVLHRMGLPFRLTGAIAALYEDVWTHITLGDFGRFGYEALRGMKQGCPLSGVLFAL